MRIQFNGSVLCVPSKLQALNLNPTNECGEGLNRKNEFISSFYLK